MGVLRQLGDTQQRLLRCLLHNPSGVGVEALCERLRISHNAVRQHLTALIGRGWVQRTASQPSGGRPQARFNLTPQGGELFPRNYAQISTALLDELTRERGADAVSALLVALGTRLGAAHANREEGVDVATHLASQLDDLGYEALPVARGETREIEAFNCVFHGVATREPRVCQFDLAFMEAASGHHIHHVECIIRGGNVCRFRVGEKLPATAPPQS